MAYEHLGLQPFAEPIPVGPGGRLGDGSAGEPVLAEVAAVAPELELAPELGELTKLDWRWETAVGWPVARPPEGAVVLGGVDPRVGRDLAERLVIARVRGRWCLSRGRGVPAVLLVSRCRVLSAFASVICVWTTCAVGCCATVEGRRAAAGVNTWGPRTPAAMRKQKIDVLEEPDGSHDVPLRVQALGSFQRLVDTAQSGSRRTVSRSARSADVKR